MPSNSGPGLGLQVASVVCSQMMLNIQETALFHLYFEFIQIDDINGFDNALIAPFMERITKAGMTKDDIDLVSWVVEHLES